MKVYFVGAHSTGKTTLARYVSKTYQTPMITEVARMVLSEKEMHLDALRYDLDQVDDYQRQIFHRQIDEERRYTDFVSDRSFVDCCAYAAQHTRILQELLQDPKVKEQLKVMSDPHSFVFFVRPSKATLKADGVREAPVWDGVVAIDAMIKFMLEMWNLKYFQIHIDNMQERIRLIDGVLSLLCDP
jgi:nicotinamide riboside kinase